MRKLVSIILILFLFAANDQASTATYAQGWRLFADKIKKEKQKEKDQAEGEGETTEELPPLFDVAQDEPIEQTEEPEFLEDEQDAGFERDAGVEARSSGMLDFSDALGDDGANYTGGDEANAAPTYESSYFAPDPPSYRAFAEMRRDARLNDLCFIDVSTGWAVGDRGTILHTTDGGENWIEQDSTTDANLFAVSFFDANYGLAVGGRVLPIAHSGQGVVLRTVDGGATWGEVATASFPILRDVRILDEESVWIAGDASSLYPSGLFFSADTGIEWTCVEGNKRAGWKAALYDPIEKLGVGITTDGAIQRVDGSQAEIRPLSLGTRRVDDVAYDGSSNRAWAVGSQGLTLFSTDFGLNWAQTPGGFPSEAQNYFDLRAVVAKDGSVGAVGSPGSLFFYSTDGGNNWNAARTGVQTPLNKIWFVDQNYGWIVGDLGVILATQDGGRTWKKQRAGADRVSLLAVLGRAKDAPMEAFVQLAGDEGFLTEVALIARELEREGVAEEIPYVERFNEALVETGVSGSTQASLFTLEPEVKRDSIEQILARFDAENDGDGLERFRERLVRLIRAWRPSVIMTVDPTLDDAFGVIGRIPSKLDPGKPAGAKALVGALANAAAKLDERPRDALQELILRELPGAIQSAADPAAYPEHLAACYLETWSVKKARLLCRGKTQGNMTIDSGYFCASLGRPIAEIAANARSLVDGSSETRDSTEFQTLFSALPPKRADKTFFDGLEIPYASDARRPKIPEREDQGTLASRAGDRRQKLGVADSLARRAVSNRKSADLLLAQLRGNIQGVDAEFAVEYLTNVGRRFAQVGAWTAAEEAFSIVALELIGVPKSREALTWLAQYYASAETERRILAQGDAALNDSKRARLENAKNLGESIRNVAPETFMAPEVRFSLAAAQAKSGDLEGAMRFYQARSQASEGDVWATRAAAEYWLRAPSADIVAKEREYCPLSQYECRKIASKPYLDGTLEPNVWESARRLDLSEPYIAPPATRESDANQKNEEWRKRNRTFSQTLGTNVTIAHDSEFLYIGATCAKARGYDYDAKKGAALSDALNQATQGTKQEEEETPRERDADLTLFDRLEFQFDLDGDYSTAYKFVFDCRGWASDFNWNDATWNPGLFVAKGETNDSWTIEVAIPLAELTDRAPMPGETWRFAVRRIAPGVGVECWNVENSDSGENAFGLMTF